MLYKIEIDIKKCKKMIIKNRRNFYFPLQKGPLLYAYKHYSFTIEKINVCVHICMPIARENLKISDNDR